MNKPDQSPLGPKEMISNIEYLLKERKKNANDLHDTAMDAVMEQLMSDLKRIGNKNFYPHYKNWEDLLLQDSLDAIELAIENEENHYGTLDYKDDDEKLNQFRSLANKYKVLSIYTRYFILLVSLDLYPIFNKAFLFNDALRRAIMTDGCIFWNEGVGDKEELKWKPLSSVKALSDLPDIGNEVVKESSFQLWKGTGLKLPEHTKILLSFTDVYPTLKVKEEGDDSKKATELMLQEQSWSVHILDNGLINKGSSVLNGKFIDEMSKKYADKITIFRRINDGSVSDGLQHDEDFPNDSNFQQVGLVIDASAENCETIVVLPYTPPRGDIYVNLKFGENRDGSREEIILTTS